MKHSIRWVDEEGDPMPDLVPFVDGPLTVESVTDALEKQTEEFRSTPTFHNLHWWSNPEMSDVTTFSFWLDTSAMVIVGFAKLDEA